MTSKSFASLPSDPGSNHSKECCLSLSMRTTCVATLLDGGHAPNALPQLWQGRAQGGLPRRFVILGAGKTAMDAAVWLIGAGAPPDAIQWVVPRDSWLVNRITTQPAIEFFKEAIGSQADQMEALALATSTEDLFLRLEACGALLRIDRERVPSMFHLATISPGEVEVLRRIRDVVRLGRMAVAQVTHDQRWVLVTTSRGTDNRFELHVIPLGKHHRGWAAQTLVSGLEHDWRLIEGMGNQLWFVTNKDAPRLKVVAVDLKHPERGFVDVIREREETLERARIVGQQLILNYLKDAASMAEMVSLDGRHVQQIALNAIGTASGFTGKPGDPETFYSFSSFNQPSAVFRYDSSNGKNQPFALPKLGFDPQDFAIEQRFYASKDGTQVPLFLVRKKSVATAGQAVPTLLYGYGGFDISLTPGFSAARMAWLEAGGAFAVIGERLGEATMTDIKRQREGWHREAVKEMADELAALAAAAYRRYRERAAGISGQLAGHGVQIGEHFVVVVKGPAGVHRHVPVRIRTNGHVTITVEGGKTYALAKDWSFGGIRATGTCNGLPFTAQVERQGLWYRVSHNGLAIEAQVMGARAAELLRVMPFKAPADMSKFLLSPMPGLLVNIAVKPGQVVQAGERLAVIEAMKMENILTAVQDGTVKEVLAAQGESLAVDQPIMAFA